MSSGHTFVTLINCMDGRTQEPGLTWMKAHTGADYVDSITFAGPDGMLEDDRHPHFENLMERILISRDKHGSKTLALIAHYDCAGNPGPKDMHLQQLDAAFKTLKAQNLGMHFLALWIDENWEVELVFQDRV